MFLIQLIKRDVRASLCSLFLKKHVVDSCVVAQNQNESPDIHRRVSTGCGVASQPKSNQPEPNRENTRLELSPHFLRLLLDERLGDCLLPLLPGKKRKKSFLKAAPGREDI